MIGEQRFVLVTDSVSLLSVTLHSYKQTTLVFLNMFLMKSLNVLIRSDESAACPRPLSTARYSSDGCSGQQKQPCS